jgi:hypothetical protein
MGWRWKTQIISYGIVRRKKTTNCSPIVETPSDGVYKINWDVAIDKTRKLMGVRDIIRALVTDTL